MIIHLVRHGQTAYNREDVFRGLTDVPLDETGRWQAEAVGRAIAARVHDNASVLSGPLARVRQTAQAIASATGFPLEIEAALTDLSFGQWEGKRRDVVAAQYPELYDTWQTNPAQCRFPAGDSYQHFAGRVTAAYDAIASRKERTVIIVSHRVVLKIIVCHVLGIGAGGFWSIQIDPASITTIDCVGEPVVSELNDVCHLQTRVRPTDF